MFQIAISRERPPWEVPTADVLGQFMSVSPTRMSMVMHMVDAMYGISGTWTFMLMVPDLDLEMDPNVERCQLMYFTESAEDDFQAAFTGAGIHVLTVGETKGFAKRGGMIELVNHRSKVRFVINREAAENAYLRVSAQLLDLAERVY